MTQSPPSTMVINGVNYVKQSDIPVTPSPPMDFWQANDWLVGAAFIFTVVFIAVIFIAIACYFYNHQGEHWRCVVFSHKVIKDKLVTADNDSVGSNEVVYCKRCLERLEVKKK